MPLNDVCVTAIHLEMTSKEGRHQESSGESMNTGRRWRLGGPSTLTHVSRYEL